MELTLLKSKLHRATVTGADLNYVGSVTIDSALMEEAGLLEYEQVQIANVDNGSRFETYVIRGKANSGIVCLNGAAARQAQVGDRVIIMSYAGMTPEEAAGHSPMVVFLDEANRAIKITRGDNRGHHR